MIKAIILDCFGVLVLPSESLIQRRAQQAGVKPEVIELGKQANYGFITQTEYENQVARITGIPVDQVRRDVKDFAHNQELIDYAQELRKTYKVGVLSNISANTMTKFFTEQEQRELFDVVVCSSDVGMVKPNVEIYEYTAEKLGVKPFEAVMIDDRQDHCEGAVLAGLVAIRYVDFEQSRNELRIFLQKS